MSIFCLLPSLLYTIQQFVLYSRFITNHKLCLTVQKTSLPVSHLPVRTQCLPLPLLSRNKTLELVPFLSPFPQCWANIRLRLVWVRSTMQPYTDVRVLSKSNIESNSQATNSEGAVPLGLKFICKIYYSYGLKFSQISDLAASSYLDLPHRIPVGHFRVHTVHVPHMKMHANNAAGAHHTQYVYLGDAAFSFGGIVLRTCSVFDLPRCAVSPARFAVTPTMRLKFQSSANDIIKFGNAKT